MSQLTDKQQKRFGLNSLLIEGQQELPFNPLKDTDRALRQHFELQAAQIRHQQAVEAAKVEASEAAEDYNVKKLFDENTTLGRVVKPGEGYDQQLRGYQWVLGHDNGAEGLEFSPAQHKAFDGIIVKRSGVDRDGKPVHPAFNPAHPHYQDFAPLRRNIALLRNYLLCEMFPDGDFLPEDKSDAGKEDLLRYNLLNEMADRLGEALFATKGSEPLSFGNDPPSFVTRWSYTAKNFLKGEELSTPYNNPFMEAANVPDKGAKVMYDYLYALQEAPECRQYTGNDKKKWPLKPREETIFSDANIALYGAAGRMQGFSDAYERDIMSQLRAPENLSPEDRAASVGIAHDILEKLKKLLASSDDQAHQSKYTDETVDQTRKILKIATSFKEQLALIFDAYKFIPGDPGSIPEDDSGRMQDIGNNKIFGEAYEAMEKLGYRMKLETCRAMRRAYEPEAEKKMQEELEKTPEKFRSDESTESLLGKVDKGLQEAARIQQQARIAQRIAMRKVQRLAERTQRETDKAIRNMRRGPYKSAERMADAAIARASGASAAAGGIDPMSSARESAGMFSGLAKDQMADVSVVQASANGNQFVRQLVEEQEQQRRAAAAHNDPNTTRGR